LLIGVQGYSTPVG